MIDAPYVKWVEQIALEVAMPWYHLLRPSEKSGWHVPEFPTKGVVLLAR
jgi:hypothetical protein